MSKLCTVYINLPSKAKAIICAVIYETGILHINYIDILC